MLFTQNTIYISLAHYTIAFERKLLIIIIINKKNDHNEKNDPDRLARIKIRRCMALAGYSHASQTHASPHDIQTKLKKYKCIE